jgi:hypothetical protein
MVQTLALMVTLFSGGRWVKLILFRMISLIALNQMHCVDYPNLAHTACDILAIPGVSISVEWLFSSSKHTLSDTHSWLTEVSALKTVVVKEWLKKGFEADVNYLDEAHTIVSWLEILEYDYNMSKYEYKLNTIRYEYTTNRYGALTLKYDTNIIWYGF